MSIKRSDFPKEFLWGVSTSSYQIEGAVKEDGRGESIWDRFCHTSGKIQDGHTGDLGCDHYHRYKEDIQLMADLGVNTYRFSIAWPRVIPTGDGDVNPKGLDFYERLVDELLKAGIKPFATLYHWDLPQVLQDRGGWANRDTAYAFARYYGVVVDRLGDRISDWITHNEPWCMSFLGYQLGIHAPGVQDLQTALQASHHLLLSHGLAVKEIRAASPQPAKVGAALNHNPASPYSDSPADVAAAIRYDGYFNRWFLDPLAGKGYPQDIWKYYGDIVPTIEPGDLEIIAEPTDFLGINYYERECVEDYPEGNPPQTRRHVDDAVSRTADRDVYPQGLFELLDRLTKEYPNLAPFYVTENGANFPDVISEDGKVHDPGRSKFLEVHFEQALRAINAGIDLRGYCVWSLMDNFEWNLGYNGRYGIVYTDFETLERTPKDSALWFKDFLSQ